MYLQHESVHRRCSVRKSALRNFAKFTGKHLCQILFLTLFKKRLWHRCIPLNFVKFLRTSFLQNTSRRLLLKSWTHFWYISTNNIQTYNKRTTKWPNTLKQFVNNLPTNCLSVFGHFMGLAFKTCSNCTPFYNVLQKLKYSNWNIFCEGENVEN